MNPLRQVLTQYKQQNALFESSRKEIYDHNKKTLQTLSAVMSVLGACVFLLSLCIPAFYDAQIVYGIGTGVALCLLVASHCGLNRAASVLGGLYFLFGVLFGLAIYLSVVLAPAQRATIFLGFIPLMPLLIIDRRWRVHGFVLVMVFVHTALSLWLKPWDVPLDDFMNCFILALLSIYVGAGVHEIRLKNFALQRAAQMHAEQDFLTGLYNRRKMYDVISESEAGGREIKGVLLFDIDHFKGYNDHYGHQAGDDCLMRVAAFMRTFARKYDLTAFRFGGEEFLAFYHGGEQGLLQLAEVLRASIYALKLPYPDQAPGYVCVSVGYCEAQDGASVHQMITAADHALYCAKNAGRNCCREGKPMSGCAQSGVAEALASL